ncbi:MAG: LytTR family DNA-binding domain-containing protein [Bacteroidales bacterium]|jgi:DNA-binding LytR/AlgR family response regulator|nr:LytTR family DNA-binding domain-containing protein [Bacteroidales bacterium]NLM92803.1 response regulator transcription factor [Bacteroidales bacterium]
MKRAFEMYEPAVTAAIVDDEFHFIEEMKKLLAYEPGIEVVATEHDPGQAVEQILQTKPDLVFLDIQMPVINGFEVIRDLKEASFEPSVIFVTAYDTFAIQAIKSAAFDYLLKPIEKRELQKSIQRFFDYHAREERSAKYLNLLDTVDYQRKIKLACAGGFLMMNLADIIYIQADWNYAKVYTGPDTYETVTMNLGALENLLPDKGFMRINRSNIINLSYLTRVRRLARKCFLMKDGHEYEFCIPITRIRELEKRL